MLNFKKRLALASIAFGASAAVTIAAQQPGGAAGPFTAAQAAAGATAYQANCASCHQPDLSRTGHRHPARRNRIHGCLGCPRGARVCCPSSS